MVGEERPSLVMARLRVPAVPGVFAGKSGVCKSAEYDSYSTTMYSVHSGYQMLFSFENKSNRSILNAIYVVALRMPVD